MTYSADRFDRMSPPENPTHTYTVRLPGRRPVKIEACSQRGAEIKVKAMFDREDSEQEQATHNEHQRY